MTQAPPLSCACHFHIFGPFERFPLDAGRAYTPRKQASRRMERWAAGLGIERMVIVQPSPCGTDKFAAWVPNGAARRRILVDNPGRLYAF